MTDQELQNALVRKAYWHSLGSVYVDDFAGYHGIPWPRMHSALQQLTGDGLLYRDYGHIYKITAQGRRYIRATDYRPSIWVRLFRWLEARW